jgi:spore coat protein U-like protein
MTIKYECLFLTLVTLNIPLFLDVTLCFNVSHPDVFFNSYNVQISVKHNNPLLFKITLMATCFSSVVLNVDFGSVHWKGLIMVL